MPPVSDSAPVRSAFAADPEFGPLLGLFVESAAEQSVRLRSAFDEGRTDRIRVAAHQLKGSAGGYGFAELSELAADLEQRCIDGTVDREDVERVVAYLGRVSN